ncbi:MAG: sensor histidine kinase [Bacillota bacterium]
MRNRHPIRLTIPNIIKYIREAEDADTISHYENVMVSTYMTTLLYFGTIATIIVQFFFKSQNLKESVFDSLFFLFVAIAFEVIIRADLKTNLVTLVISGLSALTFFFIVIRFYDLIGGTVWIVAFIQLILAMIPITRVMLYSLILTYLIVGFYIVFFQASFRISELNNVLQIFLFAALCIIAAAVHKVNKNRYHKAELYLQEALIKKEEITALYEQIAASEEEAKATLDQLRKTQEQLIQQEKLAGIGQLAAGVAHEINNPLGYISSNFETSRDYFNYYKKTLQTYRNFIHFLPHISAKKLDAKIQEIKELEEDQLDFISSDLEDLFNDIEDGLKRISEIVMGLKTFSRVEQNDQFEDYDLNSGIRNTLLIARNEIKHHARVVEILGDIPMIQAKGSQINQVLLNIILNAAYAVKDKSENLGAIIVSTERLNDYVRCEIEDNGSGIEEKNISKIFDPFFTTKPIGRGTGLGLSIAYDIVVNKHGGEISVESEAGGYTKFIIKLPIKQLKIEIGEKL